jgi:hypothetical protein
MVMAVPSEPHESDGMVWVGGFEEGGVGGAGDDETVAEVEGGVSFIIGWWCARTIESERKISSTIWWVGA